MSDDSTSSADNSKKKPRGKPFTGKDDPRRNNKGAPSTFGQIREIAQKIANEQLTSKDGSISMTRLEMIFRDWSSSTNFQKQAAFVAYAFGKVPDELNMAANISIVINWDDKPE